jgi:hypothetical protein
MKTATKIETEQKVEKTNLCILCRGARLLCGKERCPVLLRYYSQKKARCVINSKELEGASPPSVFVGRFGYPKVSIGPLTPPIGGDTSYMDTPEKWLNFDLDRFIDFRSQLVRGKYQMPVNEPESSDKTASLVRELAFSDLSVPLNAEFSKVPSGRLVLSDQFQPFGPSAPLVKIELTGRNIVWNKRIETAHYDYDLKAKDAVLDLYKSKVYVSTIQKAFSVGGFGKRKNRLYVPTRWAITAVDSTIGNELVKEVKQFESIDEFRVFNWENLDNQWVVLMMPGKWSYELIEAWYPFTTWNPYGKQIHIFSSHEFWEGRKTYAEIGGCYYAARFAVGEKLTRERKQAEVIILREVHPGYILPVGVWNVRENVRKALKTKPSHFESLNASLLDISQKLDIPVKRWIRSSELLKKRMYQHRIEDFVK